MISSSPSSETVAVVGSGLVGASWIALFLAHGMTVHAWDPNPEALQTLRARVRVAVRQSSWLSPQDRPEQSCDRIDVLTVGARPDAGLSQLFLVEDREFGPLDLWPSGEHVREDNVRDRSVLASS
jgi:hypothetical protein